MRANKTILAGTLKTGLMEIKSGETVKVIRTTSKMVYIEKDGMIKAFNKSLFD